jgi:hypothetical protein
VGQGFRDIVLMHQAPDYYNKSVTRLFLEHTVLVNDQFQLSRCVKYHE